MMKNSLMSLAVATALAASSTLAADNSRSPNKIVLATPALVSAPVAHEITRAGQLRTQSQHLTKLWLQVGLGINARAASAQIARGVAQFDSTLAALQRAQREASMQRVLQRTAESWEQYRQALSAPYSAENLTRLNYLGEDLMMQTGRLTMKIEAGTNTASGRLLDLSLRQNMLAQRLARLYLLAQAGDHSRGRQVDMEQARKEFATTLNELVTATANTQASRDALELARMQWLFFDNAISDMSRGAESRPQHVATTSERIMEVLDAVSSQYAQDYNTALLAKK